MISILRRALSDYIRHRFFHGVCLLTIALAVFIVSAFALFFINAGDLMAAWQRGVRINAYLVPDAGQDRAMAAAEAIKQYKGVESVSYVPREEGLDWLKDQIGPHSSLLSDLEGNPLPDALEISPARELGGVDALDRLAEKIAGRAEITDVEYARDWLHRFYGIYNLFRLTAFVMAGMVFVAIMFIVANTIRLILYSRREEIEITRIIGADEAFIKYPLYLEAAGLGLSGGLMGLGLLYLGYQAVMPHFSSGGLVSFFRIRFLPAELWVFILISSMIVGWMGCWFTIRRFLRI